MVAAIVLRNVRCFPDQRVVPLAPLTVLVGENSAGKSTFLATIRLAWDIAHGKQRIDFNEEPFLLGAFDQIATNRGGPAGRASFFELGLDEELRLPTRTESQPGDRLTKVRHLARFEKSGSHPALVAQSLSSETTRLAYRFPSDNSGGEFDLTVGQSRKSISLDEGDLPPLSGVETPIDWRYLAFAALRGRRRAKGESANQITNDELSLVEDLARATLFSASSRPMAGAPVRTRPQRTYNPVSDQPLPEGAHVPMVLAKTYFESDGDTWKALKAALERFGRGSGLFQRINIRALGKHESDPFQIQFSVEGPRRNLVDVGYGISQILPILVDGFFAPPGRINLLQQPEVHLHPRGQSELATFLAEMVHRHRRRFVVETHSDYFIDRVRISVREGLIDVDKVRLLFFERRRGGVKIHEIGIDQQGNLQGAPVGYRRFFLGEEGRLLGLK